MGNEDGTYTFPHVTEELPFLFKKELSSRALASCFQTQRAPELVYACETLRAAVLHSESSLCAGSDGVGGDDSKGQSSPQRCLGWHLEAAAICTGWVVPMLKDGPLEIDVDLKTLRWPVRLPEDSTLTVRLAIS